MALEGANIIGQAQVYNQTQNAVNQYARTLQQQQLQRERESKALSDELSKINVDGIRQPDIPKFTNKYQLLKDLSAKKPATRAEKIKLDREISTTWLELNQMGELSRTNAKTDYQTAGKLIDPNTRRGFTKDAVTRFQQSINLPSDDPRYISDKTTLEHQIDLSKTIKRISDIGDASLKEARYTQESAPETRGNVVGTNVGNVRRSDQQKLSDAIETEMLDDNFSTAVGQMFPNTTYEQQVAELIRMGSKAQYGESKFFPNKDDRAYNLSLRRENRIASGKGGEGGGGSPSEVTEKIFYTNETALNDKNGIPLSDNKGDSIMSPSKVSYRFDKFLPLNLSPLTFASPSLESAFSIGEGKNMKMPANATLRVTGIGYDKAGKLTVTTVDESGEQWMMLSKYAPTSVTGDDRFLSNVKKLGQSTTQGKPKSYSSNQEKLIKDNMKANPDYTRDEIIKALGY